MNVQLLSKGLNGSITYEETNILEGHDIGIDGYCLYVISMGLPSHIDDLQDMPDLIGAKAALESSLIQFLMAPSAATIGTIEWFMQFPAVVIYNEEYLAEFRDMVSSTASNILESGIPPSAIYYCYFQVIENIKKNDNKDAILTFYLLKYYILLWIAAIQENAQTADEIYQLYRQLTREYLHASRLVWGR